MTNCRCGAFLTPLAGAGRPRVRCERCAADKSALAREWRASNADAVADYNAQRALQNGRFQTGLFQRAWDGGPITRHDASPGMLRIQGAGVSVLAWLAATSPPG